MFVRAVVCHGASFYGCGYFSGKRLATKMGAQESDAIQLHQMCRQETNLELQLLGRGTVSKDEMVISSRNLSAMGSLYRSVVSLDGPLTAYRLTIRQTWFAAELNALKSTPEVALSPTTPRRLEPMSAVTPYTPYLPLMPQVLPNEQLKLPLSPAMALSVITKHCFPMKLTHPIRFRRFQALLKTYEQLAEIILHSIRIDVRCRTIHYLDAAMRHVRS
jgi:exocyst complex component 4